MKPKLHPAGDGDKYEYVDEVHAAAGVKIYASGLEAALSGSPLLVDDGNSAVSFPEVPLLTWLDALTTTPRRWLGLAAVPSLELSANSLDELFSGAPVQRRWVA